MTTVLLCLCCVMLLRYVAFCVCCCCCLLACLLYAVVEREREEDLTYKFMSLLPRTYSYSILLLVPLVFYYLTDAFLFKGCRLWKFDYFIYFFSLLFWLSYIVPTYIYDNLIHSLSSYKIHGHILLFFFRFYSNYLYEKFIT